MSTAKSAALFLLFLSIAVGVRGQSSAERAENYNIKKGIAIEGYDPVSYFDGKPLEGTASLKFTDHGVTYYFANSKNLNRFKDDPSAFEPAYGGWCAYAMGATGEKVNVDPETFKIVNHKLYLFYNSWGNNTLKDWNKDETKLKESADKNWKKIVP